MSVTHRRDAPSQARTAWRPKGPATVLIGFPLGGGSDIIGRPILNALQEIWGVAINVENLPGANGVAAALEIAESPPDGRSILLGHVSSNAIAPVVMPKSARVDRLRRLRPVSLVASQAHVLVVNAMSRARSVDDFVALSRCSDRPLTYGSTGHGSMQQIVAEHFAEVAETRLRHVPYLGSMPAMADLRAGRIDCIFEGITPAAPFIQDGIFRALALSVPCRIPGLDIPTLAEAGYPNFDMRGWLGLFAPPSTSDFICEGWRDGLGLAVSRGGVRRHAADLGVELHRTGGASFDAFVRAERKRYASLAIRLNLDLGEREFSAVVGENAMSPS